MRRYNTLTPDDIAKYKQRSEMAINGIDKLWKRYICLHYKFSLDFNHL